MSETFSENLKLSKRDTGDLNWGAGANANLDLLDKHAQLKLLRPPRTLLASLGSGAVGANLLGNTTYFYKVTSFNAAGETTENQIPSVVEAQVTQPGTPVPVILQWETVKGVTGYRIYKSTAAGSEQLLAQVAGESTAQYTDDGNTATTATAVPSTNTARLSVSKVSAGTGIGVNPSDGTGDVTIDNAGVTGLRKQGEAAALAGDVKLEEGTGITLTQDGPNNKIVIASAGGGGGGGHATEVVAAPSGNATTDTANIQAALSSASTKGGGTVLLREGIYLINANLSIPPKVTLAGMGWEGTILQGQTALDSSNVPTVTLQGGNSALRDLTVESSLLSGAGGRGDVLIFGNDFEIVDCRFDRFKSEGLYLQRGDGFPVERGIIRGCLFVDWPRAAIRFSTAGGKDIKIQGCHFQGNGSGDALDLGNGERVAIVNCTGFNVRGVVNSHLPPRSSMVNCTWRTVSTVAVHGLTLGPNCVFVGNVMEYPSANAFFAAILFDSVDGQNIVCTGNQILVETLGRGIWVFGNGHTISGNRIKSSVGIEVAGGSDSVITGNRLEGGSVQLNAGAAGNVVVGNKAAVTDNSGQTNTIASNG